MNPISTLYHIAPCCFVFLALPFTYMELPRMVNDPSLHITGGMVALLLGSAASAFGEEGMRCLGWWAHDSSLSLQASRVTSNRPNQWDTHHAMCSEWIVARASITSASVTSTSGWSGGHHN
jgi:hypothetical protein